VYGSGTLGGLDQPRAPPAAGTSSLRRFAQGLAVRDPSGQIDRSDATHMTESDVVLKLLTDLLGNASFIAW